MPSSVHHSGGWDCRRRISKSRADSLAPTPDVVIKITGHCDYKSMKPYIDITESARKDAIKKMEEAFKKK